MVGQGEPVEHVHPEREALVLYLLSPHPLPVAHLLNLLSTETSGIESRINRVSSAYMQLTTKLNVLHALHIKTLKSSATLFT